MISEAVHLAAPLRNPSSTPVAQIIFRLELVFMFKKIPFYTKAYIWAIVSFVYSVLTLLVQVLFFEYFTPDMAITIFVCLFFLLHWCFLAFYTLAFYKIVVVPRLS